MITMLVAIALQNGLAQNTQRRVSKLGVYLIDPGKGQLPSTVSFKNTIPPVTLESERELLPVFSLGTEFGIARWDVGVSGVPSSRSSEDFKNTLWSFWGGLKGVAHFKVANIVEPYVQMTIGYGKVMVTSNNDDYNNALSRNGLNNVGGTYKAFAAGANIYISDNFGIYGEAGLKESKGLFKVGVVFKR